MPKLIEVDGEEVNLGQVGDVASVNPAAVLDLIEAGRVPVVAAVAPGPGDMVYNVNADTAAAALAVALHAERLAILTDVAGLADWPNSEEIITQISSQEVRELLPSLASGCGRRWRLRCAPSRVGSTGQPSSTAGSSTLLLEIFTNEGAGTMITDEHQEA